MKRYAGLAVLFIGVHTLAADTRPPYIGWAQEAHPDYPSETFEQHLSDQKKYGANLVWIGHNNPGYVDKNKVEPGLSYAVYEAIRDPNSRYHADALEQAAAVMRLLNAARRERMKAVLAVGYQIQMGPVWSERHPEALRREHDGRLWSAGGPSASFLSPVYQHDIGEYYRWVHREWVVPYRDVLLMLNLADEPFGGDYSKAAEAVFTAETDMSWEEAGGSKEGRLRKGEFQNHYIVRYARWSADLWKTIDPSVRVTMSFCGSHGRFTNFQPSIHGIFRDTPDNFDVTFDAFLIDNQPGDPIDGKHVSALTLFLRQVGELSRRYNKRVWLWPEANNWILSQWHAVKGNISDALFGVHLLRNMSAGAGIPLGGMAVWNLDVKEQGLFRDTHPLIYDPQRMFDIISGDFLTPADPVVLRDEVLVWIPESEAEHLIGRKSYDYADRIYLLDLYAPLLEAGVIPRFSSENELPSSSSLKTIFLMSKYPPYLTEAGSAALDKFVAGGGTLITNYPILLPSGFWARAVQTFKFYGHAVKSSLRGKPHAVTENWGRGKRVLVFGKMNEKRRNIVRALPPEVVRLATGGSGGPTPQGLLVVPQMRTTIYYNTSPDPFAMQINPKKGGTLVQPDGSTRLIASGTQTVTLPHSSWLQVINP